MQITIIQALILGIVQGITEWLPISSSGMLTLVMTNFFKITNLSELIKISLFFHLGTFFAALIYFRKDVVSLLKSFFNYKNSSEENKKVLKFLIISTLISGVLGIIFLKAIESIDFSLTGKSITGIIGLLLLFTGISQLKVKKRGIKKESHLKLNDSISLGFSQGLAVLPGISRSGITISSLLLKKFDDTTALRLSFLMSLPIVLAGNIILNLNELIFSTGAIYGLFSSFIFGILTIHGLMKISKRINFGWFALIFGLLMIISLIV